MAETVFSIFKRVFGEHVAPRRYPNMSWEMIPKARLYNSFTSLNWRAWGHDIALCVNPESEYPRLHHAELITQKATGPNAAENRS